MKISRRIMAVTGVLALASIGVAQGLSAMAAPGDPQLGLRVASPHLQIERMEGDPYIFAELGTYVGTTKAALQIEAVPAADGTADLWLVRRDDKGKIKRERKIETPSRGPMSLGLPDFLDLEMKTSAGRVVSQQKLGFCPGGDWGESSQQRLDATGPAEAVLANHCGTDLTKHIVYGLDKGWAASVGNELLSNFEGADGDYKLTLKIAPTYVRQFAIPAKQATAALTMTVKTVPCPYDPEWCPGSEEEQPEATARSAADPHAGHTAQAPAKGPAPLPTSHGAGHGPVKLDPVVRAAAADVNAKSARTATLA